MSDYYAYIFMRQDLPREQQLIQFGHAACVLGKNLPEDVCPHSLNFVGIGVNSEVALFMAEGHMVDNEINYHTFHEPDIGNELTAIATVPLRGADRKHFKSYNTLRFS